MSALKLFSILILIILPSLCSCRLTKNGHCVKNSTHPADTYPPFFKTPKVCDRNLTYTLVPLGDNFMFNCSYDSNPPSKVIWSFGRLNKLTGKFDLLGDIGNSSKLTINSVNLENEGHYTCTIFNDLGQISHSFFLHVNDKPLVYPIFKHKEEEFAAAVGDKVKLDCIYETEETSSLKFHKANRMNNYTYRELIALHNGKKRADYVLYLINSSYTFDQLTVESSPPLQSLSIDNVNETSFGIYMCIAKNRYGKSVKFINLKPKTPDYVKFVVFYIVSSVIVILIMLLVFQAYLKNRVKKKLMIEKHRSIVITKRIIIDYPALSKHSLIGDVIDAANLEMNSYNCSSAYPHIAIVKERKEIVGKAAVSDALNTNKESYEIPLDPAWEIDPNRLRLDETVGQGHFGVVQRAVLYDLPLASIATKSKQPAYKPENVYSNENQLNFNHIIEHFENNSLTNSITANNITAFSNNYYGIQDLALEPYGRLEFAKSTNNETNNNDQPKARGRVVAVKKLRMDYDDTDVKTFISEMELLKKYSDHENIIHLIGTCTQTGRCCDLR